jgi:tRNA A37 threonylcarbamoyladenosine modification protein TsaB
MKIVIKIENRTVELLLLDKQKLVDSFKFAEERQLSERLLPEIDKMLKKNKLKTEDIEKIEVESDLGDNFTTYRLAKIVSDTYNWAHKNQ